MTPREIYEWALTHNVEDLQLTISCYKKTAENQVVTKNNLVIDRDRGNNANEITIVLK